MVDKVFHRAGSEPCASYWGRERLAEASAFRECYIELMTNVDIGGDSSTGIRYKIYPRPYLTASRVNDKALPSLLSARLLPTGGALWRAISFRFVHQNSSKMISILVRRPKFKWGGSIQETRGTGPHGWKLGAIKREVDPHLYQTSCSG